MIGNSVYVLAFLVAIAAVANSVPSFHNVESYAANNTNKSHDLIVGFRQPGDRLVLRQGVIKGSSWMQIVTLERTFNASRYQRITQVKALDQKTNGKGATVTLRRGGPGLNNVTLRFTSQKGHNIHFVVELYAKN